MGEAGRGDGRVPSGPWASRRVEPLGRNKKSERRKPRSNTIVAPGRLLSSQKKPHFENRALFCCFTFCTTIFRTCLSRAHAFTTRTTPAYSPVSKQFRACTNLRGPERKTFSPGPLRAPTRPRLEGKTFYPFPAVRFEPPRH